jgi:hypothetical protein
MFQGAPAHPRRSSRRPGHSRSRCPRPPIRLEWSLTALRPDGLLRRTPESAAAQKGCKARWGRQFPYHPCEQRSDGSPPCELAVSIQLRRERELPDDESPEDLLHLRHVASQQRPVIADVAFQVRADCARVERRNARLSVDGRYLLTEFGATRVRLAERLEQRIEIAATLDRRRQTIDIRVKAPRGRRRGARGDAPNRHRGSRPGRARDGGGEARASRWASSNRSR